MSQEFIKELERLKAKQGGFNTPAPVAPSFQPQAPQELSTPEFGPTLANEAQLPVSAPVVQAPQGVLSPEEKTRIGERLAQTNADIAASGETVPSLSVVPETPNMLKRGFDYFFGAPTAEQAQNILDTQPTDPAQRARLQATAAGNGSPSDLAKAGDFLFGRPENAGDPNILGPQAPAVATPAVAAPAVATPAVAAPAVAAPAMDGSQIPQAGEEGFKFAERGSPQDYFLLNTNGGTTALSPEQIARGQEYAKQQGLNFDPTTGFSQSGEAPQVQAPQGLNSTQAMLQERFGSPTISGIQSAEEGLGLRTDAQGRMIDPNVDRSSFEQKSADREARQAARPDFGEAVSDRERRAARGDDMSDADLRDIAKANQRGASASDIARGEKVAAANGIDRKTGEPLEGGVSDLDKAKAKKTNAETAKIISDINSANDTSNWDDGKKQAMKTQAKELAVWEINELPKVEKNISELRAVSDALDLGKIKTGGLGDQIPGLSNWARPFFNPDAEVAKQEVSRVIMQTLKETFPGAISDGERKALIDTIFNPQLDPKDNAKLIIGYTDRLSKAMNAKVSQVKHFREFGNLEGYTGITPRDALIGGISGTGAGGSPIEGDVNYQSDIQNKAQSLLSAQ